MKNSLLIISVLISFVSQAQYDSKGDDEISRFRAGSMWFFTGFRPAKVDKVRKYDRLIFDVTYNDWMGGRDPFQNHWASIGMNTNLMFDIPLTKGNTVALGLGAAYQLSNIRHNRFFEENELANNQIQIYEDDSLYNFKKSVLRSHSFAIPIEIRFRKESWRHFKLHVGGKIGYQVGMSNKYVADVDGYRETYKRNGFKHANNLLYSAHVRMGLRNWALYAQYNFNPMFTESTDPQLNHIQFGLSISLF